MRKKISENRVAILVYFAMGCLTAIPVFCGYFYEMDRIGDWMASGGTYRAWQALVAALQLVTLLGTHAMYRAVDREHAEASFWGTLLYLTCPARIYVFFDEGNVQLAVLSTLLPFLVWAVMRLGERCGRISEILAAVAALAAVIGAGFVPLFSAQAEERTEYALGEWFHFLIYQDGHPGLGYGIALGLLACVWLWWIQGERVLSWRRVAFLATGAVCVLLTLVRLSWGSVSMLALLAQFLLCVPAVAGLCGLRKSDEEVQTVIVPLLVILACVGSAIYTCNMLLYTRVPL